MRRMITFVGFAALAIGLLSGPTAAYALECPSLGDLKTPPQATGILGLVPKGFQLKNPDQLNAAIDLLRSHGVSADDTVNHLVAYYCPGVAAEKDLPNARKIREVRRFSAFATKIVASRSSIEDVIYNVPLKTSTSDAVRAQASNAGISPEARIARTVQSALKRRATAAQ